MSKTLNTVIIISVVAILAVGLVGAGIFFGRTTWGMPGFYPAGMMGTFNHHDDSTQFGYGAMGAHEIMGGGMTGGIGSYEMMSGFGSSENFEPLSVEETREAVENYLASYGNEDLVIEEIMVFEYNSYAIVIEESTGIGAFELLIDPSNQAVYPEYGPNMMWNLKYGMMAEGMMGGGMMNSGSFLHNDISEVTTEMTVSEAEATEFAQTYLDANTPGVVVSDEITAFYGYYTIDLEQDGEIVGMLSVNGYTGQVFPHTWHGEFIEMVHEDDHE